MLFAKSTLGTLKNLKIRMHPFKIFLVENLKKMLPKASLFGRDGEFTFSPQSHSRFTRKDEPCF